MIGSAAVQIVEPFTALSLAGRAASLKRTVTSSPGSQKPQTAACSGAAWSTMWSECAPLKRKGGNSLYIPA